MKSNFFFVSSFIFPIKCNLYVISCVNFNDATCSERAQCLWVHHRLVCLSLYPPYICLRGSLFGPFIPTLDISLVPIRPLELVLNRAVPPNINELQTWLSLHWLDSTLSIVLHGSCFCSYLNQNRDVCRVSMTCRWINATWTFRQKIRYLSGLGPHIQVVWVGPDPGLIGGKETRSGSL